MRNNKRKRIIIDVDELKQQEEVVFDELDIFEDDNGGTTMVYDSVSESEIDDMETIVLQREDDIQQLTADYIMALVGEQQGITCVEDYGLTPDDVMSLVSVIEETLAVHGVFIDHPVIAEDCGGIKRLYPNEYQTPDQE